MAKNLFFKLAFEPLKGTPNASILLLLYFNFGAMILAADFTAVSLARLQKLQILYPALLTYAPLLPPCFLTVFWLVTLRKWPIAGPILAVVLCVLLLPIIPAYADSRVAKITVSRKLELNEMEAMEVRLGIPICGSASSAGEILIVAPWNEELVRAELTRLKLLGPPVAK